MATAVLRMFSPARLRRLVMLMLGLLLTGSGAAQAATASPSVTSFTVDTSAVTYAGGDVVIAGAATNAGSCTLTVKPAIKTLARTVTCAGFTTGVTLPATSKVTAVSYTFTLTVSGPGGKTTHTATVTVPGYPKPAIDTFRATQDQVDYNGTITLTGNVRAATACTLAVKPSIKGMTSKIDCANTQASVTPPVNTRATPVAYIFTLTAKSPGGITTATTTVSAAAYPKPQVDTFSATPGAVGITGGRITVATASRFAETCTLGITPALKGWPVKVACSTATVTATLPAAATPAAYTLTYTATGTAGTSTATRVLITGVTSATAITADGSHSCALLTGGRVTCWG
ncbi:MAG: hypothetical protein KGP01_06215, partial [Actinomycetales bacterium]|nr:hypothetical protein [Actinomycetales bacterium]